MNIILRVLAVAAAVWFLYTIRSVIALFLISIIITASLHPIISKVTSVAKMPRTLSAVVVYLLFFLGLGLLVSWIVPTLSEQLEGFSGDVTELISGNPYLTNSFSIEQGFQQLTGSLGNVLSTTAGVFTGLVSAVAVISMSFYMSLQKNGLKTALMLIAPKQHQKYVASLTDRIQESFGRWMAGQLVTMIFVGILYFIVLSALGVPYASLLAVLGGLLEIVPYFGPILAAVPATIVALSLAPITGLMVVISYVTINLIENQILIPKIMNRAIGLNPVLVILALLIGAKIAGVAGLFLAVPIAGALGVFIKDVLEKKIV